MLKSELVRLAREHNNSSCVKGISRSSKSVLAKKLREKGISVPEVNERRKRNMRRRNISPEFVEDEHEPRRSNRLRRKK